MPSYMTRSDGEPASRLTDDDEAEILRRAESDPDNPPATEEQLSKPMTFAEALPELAVAMKRRGRPPVEHPKEHISLRLSPDVVDRFKASGPGWQSRMDTLLQKDLADLRIKHLARIDLLHRGLEAIHKGQRFYRVLPGHKQIDITDEIVSRDNEQIEELETIVAMLERDAALS